MSDQTRFAGRRVLARLGEKVLREYRRLAVEDPGEVKALEIRYLRLSPLPEHRQVAVRLWAVRRPATFLRAAARLFGDRDPAVRAAVVDGIAIVAPAYPHDADMAEIDRVLERAATDPALEVRAAASLAAELRRDDG